MSDQGHGDFAKGERTTPKGPERDFAEGEEEAPPGAKRDFAEGEEEAPPGAERDFARGPGGVDATSRSGAARAMSSRARGRCTGRDIGAGLRCAAGGRRARPRAAPTTRPIGRDALVVVEQGRIELEAMGGGRRTFERGAVLWLVGLPLRALHNHGPGRAVMVAFTRHR